MSAAPDANQHRLSPAEHQRIFEERIVPTVFAGATPVERPMAVVFGGQPGSGKSNAVDVAAAGLADRGGAAVIVGDDFRAHHPKYADLLRQDDKTAAFYTDRDTAGWIEKSIAHAATNRFNVVVEGTMRNPDKVAETLTAFRDAGYETHARVLVVPESLSKLGIVERYEQQRATLGFGRMTTGEAHQAAYDGMPQSVARIEQDKLADRLTLQRRDGTVLHDNRLKHGQWTAAPTAGNAIAHDRQRELNAGELQQLVSGYARVAVLMHDRQAPASELRPIQNTLESARNDLDRMRGLDRDR